MSQTVSTRVSTDGTPRGQTAPPVPALEIKNLRKEYGRKVAVKDLSLVVQPGEVFGFLGPNGAGKTTTVKVVLGLVEATSGEVRIYGEPIGNPTIRKRVGYLPENFSFHDWLTGSELLDFHGRLAGMSAVERRARIPEVLHLVGLDGRGDDRVRGYSKGMTQRIGLAQAVMHRPSLVLLDEPTSALDPIGRREVRDLIRVLRSEGMAVFLNSHLLSEIEMVCDRVAIVDQGEVVGAGPLHQMLAGVAEIRLTVDRVDRDLVSLLARFGEIKQVENLTLRLAVDDVDIAPEVAEAVIGLGYRLFSLTPVHQSLEDVFVTLVEGTSL